MLNTKCILQVLHLADSDNGFPLPSLPNTPITRAPHHAPRWALFTVTTWGSRWIKPSLTYLKKEWLCQSVALHSIQQVHSNSGFKQHKREATEHTVYRCTSYWAWSWIPLFHHSVSLTFCVIDLVFSKARLISKCKYHLNIILKSFN